MAMARIGHRQHLYMYAPMYCTALYCTVHASLVGLPPPPLWHARQLPFTRLPLLRLCLCYLFSRILRHEQDTCRAETHSLLPLLLAASSHHRTHIARPTMHTYTAEDFDIEMDELDSDAASSSRAAMATDTVKRRRRTTKKEQAILEALFEEVGPSSTVYTDIALLMCMHHPYCSRAPRQPRHASASAPRLT